MTISRIKQGITNRTMRFINERRGWKTDRKIVVIESDDWGSIRMPSREVYERMLASGLRVDKCGFCKNDSLASNEDFEHLYSVLTKHKDKNGNHPVITANAVVANPDFDKIKESNFTKYYFETFTETLKRYPNHSFKSWQDGMSEKLFFPQFHGREHLNISRWMSLLQNNSKEVHNAFDNKYFGISSTISNENNPSFMAALDMDSITLQKNINESLKEGLTLFQQIFGYNSKSFIAPNYVWNNEVEDILSKNGVDFLQGGGVQHVPLIGNKYNYTGKVNKNNQFYLTRNVVFEPSSLVKKDWISSVMKEMATAFNLKKPAIICSHRVTFIGGIFEKNRTNNLMLLDSLLSKIIKKWPDVEFMTSVELGNLIKNKEKI